MTTKKDDFIFTMEALKQQMDYDKVWSETMTNTLGADVIPIYNNGILVNTLISEMCSWFPDAEEAKREISRFMYELDFGRCKGCEVISVEDLWESMNKGAFTKEHYQSFKGYKLAIDGGLILVFGNLKNVKVSKEESEMFFKNLADSRRPDTRDDMEAKTDESDFQEIADAMASLLQYKNKKYGNSALAPLEIFQGKTKLGTRLDDKLARIKNGEELAKNDVSDTIGYLMLICKEKGWNNFDEFKD